MTTEAEALLPAGEAPRRILVVRLSSLGDVVRITGVLAALRRLFPAAEIVAVTGTAAAPLLRPDPSLDRLLVARPARRPLALSFDAWRQLRTLRRAGIDLALDLQGTDRSARWMRWSGAACKAGRGGGAPDWRAAVAPDYGRGDVEESALILRRLGLDPGPCLPRLATEPAAEAAVAALLARHGLPAEGFVAINPFSRWPAKTWPADSWQALLPQLAASSGRPLVVTGDRREAAAAESLLRGLPAGTALSLAGAVDLAGLAALLRRAALLVTGDSGPMHMAAALDTPVVALFGPTWPERAGPQGEGHVVLQAARLPHYHAYRQEKHQAAMAAIAVESVLASALAKLAEPAPRQAAGP